MGKPKPQRKGVRRL